MGLMDLLGQFLGAPAQTQQLTQSSVPAPVQAPSAPADQSQSSGLSPLVTSLLAGYASAIGSPRLSGWGGALSKGILGGLGAYSNASYLQSRQAQEAAYMRRALAQADKADAALNVPYYDPSDKTYHIVGPGQVPPQGSIPLNSMPSLISAQNKNSQPKWVWKETQDADGHTIGTWVSHDDQGNIILPGQSPSGSTAPTSPPSVSPGITDSQAPTASAKPQIGLTPEGGLRSKPTQLEQREATASVTSRNVGNVAMNALDQLAASGKAKGLPGAIWSALAYKAGWGGGGSEGEARDWLMTQLDAEKQQLMTAALATSGSRAQAFIKLVDTHFPSKWYSDEANRRRLHAFLDKGGILDQWDAWRTGGKGAFEVQPDFMKKYGLDVGNGAQSSGQPAAPPPEPPVARQGDPIPGPDGQLMVHGVDGRDYLYTPGVGWQRIKQ